MYLAFGLKISQLSRTWYLEFFPPELRRKSKRISVWLCDLFDALRVTKEVMA